MHNQCLTRNIRTQGFDGKSSYAGIYHINSNEYYGLHYDVINPSSLYTSDIKYHLLRILPMQETRAHNFDV
jgi:hypothetical protein